MRQPTAARDAVADFHALLSAAGGPGPYVLVGHSYGDLIARFYAGTYPKDVSGLVLIDALIRRFAHILEKGDCRLSSGGRAQHEGRALSQIGQNRGVERMQGRDPDRWSASAAVIRRRQGYVGQGGEK